MQGMTGRATDCRHARTYSVQHIPPYRDRDGRTDRFLGEPVGRDGRRSSGLEPRSVFVQATSGTQATKSRPQTKGDFSLDPADIRGIAILRVTFDFPDAAPAVAPAVAGQGIIGLVEGTSTNTALCCVLCHGLVFRPFSMETTVFGRLMM
jgi:hypothetical protein